MKIAFISLMTGSSWGGSESLWTKTASLALEQGHSVFISVYQWDCTHERILGLKKDGGIVDFRKRYNPDLPLLKKIKSYIQNKILKVADGYKKMWEFQPDHILISQGNNFDIAVHHFNLYENIIKKKIPYSLICHSHSQFSFIPQNNIYPRAKDIFLEAQKVFFISDRQRKVTEKALLTKLCNADFTWNPLNLKEYEYIKWPQNNTIQFAIVGGLISGKGQDIIIEILSQEKWKKRNWNLNIYGKGYGEKYLKDLSKWYGIEERVTFKGHVNDISKVWKSNHILLIPSSGEGLPISLCEAMICGRPAVVSDVGGHREVITEDETGFIAEAPTVYSFEKALDKAWYEKKCWENMGKNSNEFIKNKLDFKPEETVLSKLSNER